MLLVYLFCFVILGIEAVFLAFNIELLKIHFVGSDRAWDAFPSSCLPNSHSGEPILNCVRTGLLIPNPQAGPGLDSISPHSYDMDPDTLLSQFSSIIHDHLGCTSMYKGSDWEHFRCLSELLGVPADLAFRVVPDIAPDNLGTNTTNVWVHSQSRDSKWDLNQNDARVRLLFTYKYLCDEGLAGITCK